MIGSSMVVVYINCTVGAIEKVRGWGILSNNKTGAMLKGRGWTILWKTRKELKIFFLLKFQPPTFAVNKGQSFRVSDCPC